MAERGMTVREFLAQYDYDPPKEIGHLLDVQLWHLTVDDVRLLYQTFPENNPLVVTLRNRGIEALDLGPPD